MDAPQVPPSPEMPFRTRLRTRWSDEDNQSVLNNPVYMTLFEEARHAYFSEHGMLSENKFPFLLLQTNVRFVAPGRGGEGVFVELATTHAGRSSFSQAYRVRSADGETWCEAEAVLVLVDAETGRAAPMSDAFRTALGAALTES